MIDYTQIKEAERKTSPPMAEQKKQPKKGREFQKNGYSENKGTDRDSKADEKGSSEHAKSRTLQRLGDHEGVFDEAEKGRIFLHHRSSWKSRRETVL